MYIVILSTIISRIKVKGIVDYVQSLKKLHVFLDMYLCSYQVSLHRKEWRYILSIVLYLFFDVQREYDNQFSLSGKEIQWIQQMWGIW